MELNVQKGPGVSFWGSLAVSWIPSPIPAAQSITVTRTLSLSTWSTKPTVSGDRFSGQGCTFLGTSSEEHRVPS